MLVRYQCQLYETPGYATVRLRNQINKYTCMTPPKWHYTETVSYFVFIVVSMVIKGTLVPNVTRGMFYFILLAYYT